MYIWQSRNVSGLISFSIYVYIKSFEQMRCTKYIYVHKVCLVMKGLLCDKSLARNLS